MALHPPVIRYVKGYPYRVQPGDHVTQICGRFGMPASKWPELVGANLHKPTCGCGGTLYKCFSRLEPGELLRIPAHWREPGGQFGLGLPTLPNADMMAAFAKMVQAYLTANPGAWPLPNLPPTPQNIEPISQIIHTWFPYLRNLPGPTNVPGFPTDPTQIATAIANGLLTEQNFGLLISSANSFLKAIGIDEGKPVPNWVKAIPWGDIPWNTIGKSLLSINAVVWGQLNEIFAKKDPANVPPQIEEPYTTPPTLPLPNFFDPSTWNADQPAGKVVRSAQFASTRWDSPFTQAVVTHKDFISCSAKRAGTTVYTKLVKCEECYTTPDDFVALLCSDKADPCLDCKASPPLPPVDPGKTDPSQPPKTEPVKAEESDNTFTYAAAAVGVVLVGGLIVMMSGDK